MDEDEAELEYHTSLYTAAFVILDASLKEKEVTPIVRAYFEKSLFDPKGVNESDFLEMVYKVKMSRSDTTRVH